VTFCQRWAHRAKFSQAPQVHSIFKTPGAVSMTLLSCVPPPYIDLLLASHHLRLIGTLNQDLSRPHPSRTLISIPLGFNLSVCLIHLDLIQLGLLSQYHLGSAWVGVIHSGSTLKVCPMWHFPLTIYSPIGTCQLASVIKSFRRTLVLWPHLKKWESLCNSASLGSNC
jgi:hypothetical protein